MPESHLETLTKAECLDLLENHSYFGRLSFARNGRSEIFPVNYLAEKNHIYIGTNEGTKLSSLEGGRPVVFEVDNSTPLLRTGWSVIVKGIAQEVTDEKVIENLARGPLKSWAGPTGHWLDITIEDISGRNLLEADHEDVYWSSLLKPQSDEHLKTAKP